MLYVDKFVTTYEDLIKHPIAIPPFKPCRCSHVFSVELEVAHSRMRKKPANVDFVDLDSVIDAVNAYGLLCTGEKEELFHSKLLIIPEKQYIAAYKSTHSKKHHAKIKAKRTQTEKLKFRHVVYIFLGLLLVIGGC